MKKFLIILSSILAICPIGGIANALTDDEEAAIIKRIGPGTQKIESLSEVGLDFYSQDGKVAIFVTKYGAYKNGLTWKISKLKKITGSDASTFKKINNSLHLYGDKNALYYIKNERGKLDLRKDSKMNDTVKFVHEPKNYLDPWTISIKDDQLFWSISPGKFHLLPDFNGSEYEEIASIDNMILFRDNEFVYYGILKTSFRYKESDVVIEKLQDADAATFKMADAEHAKDKNATYYFDTSHKSIGPGTDMYGILRNKPSRTPLL